MYLIKIINHYYRRVKTVFLPTPLIKLTVNDQCSLHLGEFLQNTFYEKVIFGFSTYCQDDHRSINLATSLKVGGREKEKILVFTV